MKFADDSTLQVKLKAVWSAGLYFEIVQGSARDANGDPMQPFAQTPMQGVGDPIGFSFVFNTADHLATELLMNICVAYINYQDNLGYSGWFRKEYVCPH